MLILYLIRVTDESSPLAHSAPRGCVGVQSRRQEGRFVLMQPSGSFYEITKEEIDSFEGEQLHNYKEVVAFMREQMAAKEELRGMELGDIAKLEVQIVEGLNFRITFYNPNEGLRTTVVVYDQPWTKTRQLKDYSFAIDEL